MNFKNFYFKLFQEKVSKWERYERIYNSASAVALVFCFLYFAAMLAQVVVKVTSM